MTVFVYLNTVAAGGGGETRWRWTDYDARRGGKRGAAFYGADPPPPGHGATSVDEGSWKPTGPPGGVAVRPTAGTAVVHFPATVPASGGVTDYNAYHEVIVVIVVVVATIVCRDATRPRVRIGTSPRRARSQSDRRTNAARTIRDDEGAVAGETKYVAQQFIWSHPGLAWRDVVDAENWEPARPLTDEEF